MAIGKDTEIVLSSARTLDCGRVLLIIDFRLDKTTRLLEIKWRDRGRIAGPPDNFQH